MPTADDHENPNPVVPTVWRPSRRALLRAGSLFAGLAATAAVRGSTSGLAELASASGGTKAVRWDVDSHPTGPAAESVDGYQTIPAEFPFYAVGGSWPGDLGTEPALQLEFSNDGKHFGAPVTTYASVEDDGRLNRDGRIFVALVFVNGPTYLRYQVVDSSSGEVIRIHGLQITYIDATSGPESASSFGAASTTLTKPSVVTRAGWGADESYRFDAYGEIWPPEYVLVGHVIIHHTATPNGVDPFSAVRSIYYYHAIDRGWGDIGYNYLVDSRGRVYEGRFGGDNVVGGHSFQYAYGSSGIAALGTFDAINVSSDCRSALTAITGWVGRNLNLTGRENFMEVLNLPTICGHRDTNDTECPGDVLFSDLPSIRTTAAGLLKNMTIPPASSVPPANALFSTHENVVIAKATSLKLLPSNSSTTVEKVAVGLLAAVVGAPRVVSGHNWYWVNLEDTNGGNVREDFLAAAPSPIPPSPRFEIGDLVKANVSTVRLHRYPGLAQGFPYTLPKGDTAIVTNGPTGANGVQFFGIDAIGNATGWVQQTDITLRTPRSLKPNPSAASVTKVVTLAVGGFPASSAVSVTWDGKALVSGETTSSGTASLSFKVPAAKMGSHSLHATSGRASATSSFTVQPSISLGASSGPTGSTLKVVLRGYDAGESVKIQWLNGTTWQTLATGVVASNGGGQFTVTVPVWAPAASSIRGLTTSANLSIAFKVKGTPAPTTVSTTPTKTPTSTPTKTPTQGPASTTASPTSSASGTATPTATATVTATSTSTSTATSTATSTPTSTATSTDTPTSTPSETPTASG